MKNTEATPTPIIINTKAWTRRPELHRTHAGKAIDCWGMSLYGPDHEATCSQYNDRFYWERERGDR